MGYEASIRREVFINIGCLLLMVNLGERGVIEKGYSNISIKLPSGLGRM